MKAIKQLPEFLLLLLCYPIFLICSSCNQNVGNNSTYENSLKLRENELLKREIELKNKELAVTKQELADSKSKEIPISELYKQVKPGVFLIYTQGQEDISQGTGFFLNYGGMAISNFHVFKNADKAVVILENGEEYLISEIIDVNEDLDYIIFRVADPTNNCYPLKISNETPEIGSTCFAIGNPNGLTQTLSIGNISGYRDENKLIQTTAEITHGSSGGPLFDRNGQVIGITSSGFDEANLNFALNIKVVPFQQYLSSDATIIKSSFSNESQNSPSITIPETTSEKENVPIELIKTTIRNYYTTISQNDYSALRDLYTPSIDRYFSSFNITQDQAVENAKIYWVQFKIISATNNIKWETLKVDKSSYKGYYISFNMDYVVKRQNKSKNQSYNLDIIMTITDDMKIQSIYENIIHKH